MFAYNANIISDLEEAISQDRLSTYLKATKNSQEAALKLYLWNSEVSSAFYMPLQGLEITLRNVLHDAMSARFGSDKWYEIAPLDQRSQDIIQTAKENVRRNYIYVNAPHVVAELSFGFWVSLLNKKYHQSLWIPALGKAFPHAHSSRAVVHQTLDHIRILRNRIAHHEPILGRHLTQDYQSIIRVIGWMNKTKSIWIDHHNSFAETWKRKP